MLYCKSVTIAGWEGSQCINFNDPEVGKSTHTVEDEMQMAAVQPARAAKVETNRDGAPDDGRISENLDKIGELVAVAVIMACTG